MRIWRCLDFGWCKHVSPGWTIVRAKKVCCRLSGELHRFDGEAGGPEGGDEKKNLDDEDSSLPPKKYHLPNRHFPPAPSSKFNFKRMTFPRKHDRQSFSPKFDFATISLVTAQRKLFQLFFWSRPQVEKSNFGTFGGHVLGEMSYKGLPTTKN